MEAVVTTLSLMTGTAGVTMMGTMGIHMIGFKKSILPMIMIGALVILTEFVAEVEAQSGVDGAIRKAGAAVEA